ncbi:Abi family protein [Serratia sp. TSA_198.1]|uniref:Abi family protein n=1 Tax=Serratia sp. TSA_198.1 TaxID=3415664 RepID=UPI0040455324
MIAAKPHKEYEEQLHLLLSRGMLIADHERAIRKLTQVGYYRLSGFWYTSRVIVTGNDGLSYRTDQFLAGTTFEHSYDLYLFDKKLRLLMLDALERIEIHVRSVIAHEVGRRDPLAYRNAAYINPRFTSGHASRFDEWCEKQEKKIRDSRDECILWHRNQGKEIPFWVAVETWDFGQMSKYYSMLNGGLQSKVIRRFGLDNKQTFAKWLNGLNLLRNRCAHHARIWNRKYIPLAVPQTDYFNSLKLEDFEKERLYGLICVIWYLVKRIGPSSNWLRQLAEHIDSKPNMPGCAYHAMGIRGTAFPRDKFGPDLGLLDAVNEPLSDSSDGQFS